MFSSNIFNAFLTVLALEFLLVCLYGIGKYFCLTYYYKSVPYVRKVLDICSNDNFSIPTLAVSAIFMLIIIIGGLSCWFNNVNPSKVYNVICWFIAFLNSEILIIIISVLLNDYHKKIKIKKGFLK